MGTVGSVTVAVKAESSQLRTEMVKNQAVVKEFAQAAQAAGQTASGALQSTGEGAVVLSQGLAAGTQAAGTLTAAMGILRGAIMTAFPIAGAFALLEILEKIANNKFAQAAIDISNGFRTMNLSAETSIDTLKLSTAKMQEQIDLLSGKRPNTLAEDLADAALAADKLASSLDADNRKIKQLLEQQKISAWEGIFTNWAGTKDVEGSIKSFDQDIAHLAAVYDHAVRTGSPDAAKDLGALDAKRLDAARWQSDQLEQRQRLQAEGVGPKQDANIAALTGFGDVLTNQSDIEADERQNKKTAIQLKTLEDQKKYDAEQKEAQRKAAEEQKKAQELLLRQDEEAEKQQNAFNKMTINEQIQFWTDRIAAFTKGGQQFIEVQDKIYDLIAKRPDLFTENKKNQATAGKSAVEGNDLLDRAQKTLITEPAIEEMERATKANEKYNETVAKGAEAQGKAAAAYRETSIAIGLQEGTISKLGAAQALAVVHADEHVAALAAVNKELRDQLALINSDSNLKGDDLTRAVRNANQAAAGQTDQINGAYAVTQRQDAANIYRNTSSGEAADTYRTMLQNWSDMTANIAQAMTRAADSFNSDIAAVITGHGKKADFGKTFSNLGESLVKASLQKGESALFRGGQLGASQNNPIWTRDAVGVGVGTPGAPNPGPFIRPFIGGLQGQGGGQGSQSGGGSIWSRLIGAFIPGIGHLGSGSTTATDDWGLPSGFQGGFASGGDVLANRPALVGESGPEMFTPRSAGTITPNSALGGGDTNHFYSIDARGATDPAAIHAAVARALPHAVAASVQAVHAQAKRTPQGR